MSIVGIIVWIIIGALAGWIASMIMKTNAQMGFVANVVVGIIGALIGGFIMRALTGSSPDGFISEVIVAIIGAVILLGILKLFMPHGHTTTTE